MRGWPGKQRWILLWPSCLPSHCFSIKGGHLFGNMTLTDGKVFIGVQREVLMENNTYSMRKATSGENSKDLSANGSMLYKWRWTSEWNRHLIWKEGEDERVTCCNTLLFDCTIQQRVVVVLFMTSSLLIYLTYLCKYKIKKLTWITLECLRA